VLVGSEMTSPTGAGANSSVLLSSRQSPSASGSLAPRRHSFGALSKLSSRSSSDSQSECSVSSFKLSNLRAKSSLSSSGLTNVGVNDASSSTESYTSFNPFSKAWSKLTSQNSGVSNFADPQDVPSSLEDLLTIETTNRDIDRPKRKASDFFSPAYLAIDPESNLTGADLACLPADSKKLRIYNCWQLRDPDLANLHHLEGLEELDLTWTFAISDAGLAQLEPHKALHTLNLSDLNRVGPGLAVVQELPALRDLNLSRCAEVTDANMAHLGGHPFKRLVLNSCSRVSDAGMQHIDLSQIEELQLNSLKQIGDPTLELLQNSHHLRRLDLNRCYYITDQGLSNLSQLTQLQHLELGECSDHPGLGDGTQMTDAGLKQLSGLTNLEYLSLTNWSDLSNDGLKHLQNMHKLKELKLIGCHQLTDAAVPHLLALPGLQKLDVTECPRLSQGAIDTLRAAMEARGGELLEDRQQAENSARLSNNSWQTMNASA
jgi:hypothetical protein